MSQAAALNNRPAAHQVLDTLKRWRRRNQAIRELRSMPRWRLADLGISRDQIPAFVDGLLSRQAETGSAAVPTELQSTRAAWMPGPWADGVGGY